MSPSCAVLSNGTCIALRWVFCVCISLLICSSPCAPQGKLQEGLTAGVAEGAAHGSDAASATAGAGPDGLEGGDNAGDDSTVGRDAVGQQVIV